MKATFTWEGTAPVPPFLYVLEVAEAHVRGREANRTESCDNNIPGWSATLDTAGIGTTQNAVPVCVGSEEHVSQTNNGGLQRIIETNGNPVHELEQRALTASLSVFSQPGNGSVGNFAEYAYVSYKALPILVTYPGLTGNPLLGQNEYVMTGNGPFSIPCAIQVQTEDANLVEYYRQRTGWALTRSLPNPLPFIANGSSTYSGNYGLENGNVFPQFRSDIGPAPGALMQGMGFSTLNGLPANNSDFGFRYVKHIIDNMSVYSPIEVFYSSTATTHPDGGPLGYEPGPGTKFTDHSTSARIPNWLYYYNQAYPSVLPIEYVNSNLGGYYYPGDDHIHLGNQAHGVYNTELFELRSPYAGQENSNHGTFLDYVGIVTTYGIDTYAQVIAHEVKHKWIYDTYHTSIIAAMGMNNGVPDTLTDANGNTVPNDPNADPDGDRLPTGYEQSMKLNPLNPDSAMWIPDEQVFDDSGEDFKYPNSSGDNEVIARIAQKGVSGPRDKDWADDGLNRGTMPGLYNERVKVTWFQPEFAYQSPGGPY